MTTVVFWTHDGGGQGQRQQWRWREGGDVRHVLEEIVDALASGRGRHQG